MHFPRSEEQPASERLIALRAGQMRATGWAHAAELGERPTAGLGLDLGVSRIARSTTSRSLTPSIPDDATVVLPAVGSVARGMVGRLLERWMPQSWRTARWDPGRRGAVALVSVTAVAAVVSAVGAWRDRPVVEPAPPLADAASPASPVSPKPAESARPGNAEGERALGQPTGGGQGVPLVVSVAGKVRNPGLVRVPEGARVADVITSAGGPLPNTDLTMLNMARRVVDGEQILVGMATPPGGQPAEGPPPSPAVSGPGKPAGGKVDLNQATLEQLDTLPGIGPITAQRILDWRNQHGRFTSVEQLREIEGIGERRLNQLRSQVTV